MGGRESTEWKWKSDLHISDCSFLESLLRNTQLLFRSLSIISVWVKNNAVKSKQEDQFLGPEEVSVDHAWKIDWEYLADIISHLPKADSSDVFYTCRGTDFLTGKYAFFIF